MSLQKFPLLELSGTPTEIGSQHGKQAQERIERCIRMYQRLFEMNEAAIFHHAAHYKERIQDTFPEYAEEIEAIATGAATDPLWIYALNARTEILSLPAQECTSFYFPKTSLLGQNWDWSRESEDLAMLVKIVQAEKPTILMMTEPGIIGKIGFNSAGLGVCLNMLHSGLPNDGIPIHVLLRAVLECSSIEEAKEKIIYAGGGRSGNLLIGDAQGNYCDIEFAGEEMYVNENSAENQNTLENFIHANHYLTPLALPDATATLSSLARQQRGNELRKGYHGSLEEVKRFLLDQGNVELPICRPYRREEGSFEESGTVCSIIMDLPKRVLHLTKGSPLGHEFEEVSV